MKNSDNPTQQKEKRPNGKWAKGLNRHFPTENLRTGTRRPGAPRSSGAGETRSNPQRGRCPQAGSGQSEGQRQGPATGAGEDAEPTPWRRGDGVPDPPRGRQRRPSRCSPGRAPRRPDNTRGSVVHSSRVSTTVRPPEGGHRWGGPADGARAGSPSAGTRKRKGQRSPGPGRKDRERPSHHLAARERLSGLKGKFWTQTWAGGAQLWDTLNQRTGWFF